jgi:uncharacterized membrane protein YagU involved in acid resistance
MATLVRSPAPVRGLAAGLAAGLIASFAMEQFQKIWAKAVPMPESGAPATVKAARKLSLATTGKPLAEADEKQAGNAVHYLFGAALGAAYGLIAEYRPAVTAGFGSGFGLATTTLVDELAVPAAGLGKAPTEVPAVSHAYTYASHLLFGGVVEGVRRMLRGR